MVGGGIHGAAVARDASLRGLSVLLLESGDLASGTSSRSSKLIHGGIRYLETAQFGLVREALRERAILLETAAPFVRPVRFLIPHYKGSGRGVAWITLGLALYSRLARHDHLAEHRRLTRSETLTLEPGLNPAGLTGGSLFWDAQMDDALLCVAIAVDASRTGADVRTHTAVTALHPEPGGWRVQYRDAIDGAGGEASARCVVNAAGPWADDIRGMAIGGAQSSIRRTRGTHIVLPGIAAERALLLTARRDGRVFFVLPWGQHSLIGTTDDDDSTPPGGIAPSPDDIRYLIAEAGRVLLPAANIGRPVRAFAGVRALARRRGGHPWGNPREHRVIVEKRMLTLIGGKYTTHRSLAERVVDRAIGVLGRSVERCRTATTPIGSTRAACIASLGATNRGRIEFEGGLAVTEAEVVHAATVEKARRLDDVLLRRTRLWLDSRALRRAADPTASWMSGHLHWSEERRRQEVQDLLRALDAEERRIGEAME